MQRRPPERTPDAAGVTLAPPAPPGAEPRTRDVLLFASPLFKIGRFHSPREAPDFATAGPIVGPVFVFPRTSVWIEHEGSQRFVADVHSVTLYNTGQPYRQSG